MSAKTKSRRKRVTIIEVSKWIDDIGNLKWWICLRPPFGDIIRCAAYKRKSDAMKYANKWEAELNDAEYDVEGD